MIVGITYDLRQDYLDKGFNLEETAELDSPETIDAIEGALVELGFDTKRIGSHDALAAALASGKRWDMVFNIAEGLFGLGRESLVPCLLDAYRVPYTFSDPLVLAICLHKGTCKRFLRDLGIATPDFHVVEHAKQVFDIHLPPPLFAKPVAEGTSKGITERSLIPDTASLGAICLEMLTKYRQPVLIERFLPGDEYTVGIVGTGESAEVLGILSVQVDSKEGVYSYDQKRAWEDHVSYSLGAGDESVEREITQLALATWRGLGCRDAGRLDIKLDECNQPSLIEVNPLAGLNPRHSDLPILCRLSGIPYQTLISSIMDSALGRLDQ